MGRLTEYGIHKGDKGIWVKEEGDSKTFFAFYDEGYKAIDKLAHYEDLEEQGRLIELPCAVGEIVWIARDGVPVQESILFRESDILCLVEDGYIFGTTKEEAEAKLKELEGVKE